jgi:hypothetical protein
VDRRHNSYCDLGARSCRGEADYLAVGRSFFFVARVLAQNVL